jgi:hypothetical protein
MTKLFRKIHIYSTGADGPRTTTPHVNDAVAQGSASAPPGNTQASAQINHSKSLRESTVWRNRLFTVTKNVTRLGMEMAPIDAWVKNAPPHCRKDYRRVAQQIKDCLKDSTSTALEISNPNIRDLPPLPAKLTSLTLRDCVNLTRAPDLTKLTQLTSLALHRCISLTNPPDVTACPQLNILDLQRCSALTTLPDLRACGRLGTLDFSECRSLEDPPDLSGCVQLRTLGMSGCERLTALPNVIACAHLQQLNAAGCRRVTTLPGGCSSLTRLLVLDLSSVPLTSVPEDLLQLRQGCQIDLNVSHLSDRIRNTLMAAANASGYTGPLIRFAMGARPQREARTLEEAAQFWRNAANSTGNAPPSGWDSFKNEEGAENFSQFLDRLTETGEYVNEKIRPDFIQRIGKLLDQLERPENTELRGKCFAEAGSAIEHCGDRVALALLDMEMSCCLHQLETDVQQGKYDADPAALCEAGRGFHRMEQLREISRQKVATLSIVDEIEVYLGFLVQLSKEFDLPVKMETMLYPRCSNIKDADVEQARKLLNGKEESKAESDQLDEADSKTDWKLLKFLGAWGPVGKLLTRLVPESEMAKEEVDIGKKVKAEQARIRGQLDALSNGPDYQAKAKELMVTYNRLDQTVRAEFMAGLVAKYLMKKA